MKSDRIYPVAPPVLRGAQTAGAKIALAMAVQINSGRFGDPESLADVSGADGIRLHLDGAFGGWASSSRHHRHLIEGQERADGGSENGHQWLQQSYASGIAAAPNAAAHHWAAGQTDHAEMVGRHSDAATLLGRLLADLPGVRVHTDEVLNQVALSFRADHGSFDLTQEMEARLNADGRIPFRTANWNGDTVLRISEMLRQTDADRVRVLAGHIAREWRELLISWHAR